MTILQIPSPARAPAMKEAAPAFLPGLDREGLAAAIAPHLANPKQARMRAGQIFRWIYHAGVQDFSAMTNIARELRETLASHFSLQRPQIVSRQVASDGVRKWLLRSAEGIEFETVFIPDVARYGALCVSSQVGCTLTCSFCHTGTQKLVRNLSTAEILGQIMVARDDLDDWGSPAEARAITNVVFMGMGEPLYNLDHVAEAIDILADGEGISIGRRRVTVSTAGVAPRIPELGTRTNAMLAISLHATRDDLRDDLVPLNRKYPIAELLESIRAYPGLSNARRVTFEYVMLRGVNDSLAEARALVKLLAGIPAKINLIPFNPWPGAPFLCSDRAQIEAFADIVNRAGYAAPIRKPRGRDILAACGQLRSESVKARASARRAMPAERPSSPPGP